MTAAFDKFMSQNRMTGSNKADGYSDDAFLGLEPHEKDIVFELLRRELPWSVEWLFLVDQERALSVAKEQEAILRGDGYSHVFLLQEQIVKHTGDLKYQENLIEDYSNYIDRLKPLAVDAVNRMPVTQASVDFFIKVIFSEVNSSAVARASRHLLRILGYQNEAGAGRDEYMRLMGSLRSENIQQKKSALHEVMKNAWTGNFGKN